MTWRAVEAQTIMFPSISSNPSEYVTQGQAVQDFPHLFMPFRFSDGYLSGGGGSLDLTRMFLKFACLLNAIKVC